ncbi:uncharacterized protein CBL_08354 [Carabus blaptoides fortunei]
MARLKICQLNKRCTCLFVLCISFVACGAANQCYEVYEKGVSVMQQNIIVDSHNAIRLQVAQGILPNQPKASNMKRISWDNSLAQAAQNIANTCVYDHVPVDDSRFAVGENINLRSATSHLRRPDWTSAINAWVDEYKTYQYGTTVYNNYTQLVWANTMYVGCGYTHFKDSSTSSNKKYYVCNYGPEGNYIGQTPYNIGNGCNNLC